MVASSGRDIPDSDLQGNSAHIKERWGDVRKLQELAEGQVLAEDIARVEQAVVGIECRELSASRDAAVELDSRLRGRQRRK